VLRCRESGRGGGGIHTPPAAPIAPAAGLPRARIWARFAGLRRELRNNHARQRQRCAIIAASGSSGAEAGAGLPRARIWARFAGLRSAAGCRAAAGAGGRCGFAAAAARVLLICKSSTCANQPQHRKKAKNRPQDWQNPGGGISLTLGRGPFSVVFDDSGAKTHQIRLREALVSMQNVFFTLAGFGQNAKRLLLLKTQGLRVAAAGKAAAAAPLTLNNATRARVYINPLY